MDNVQIADQAIGRPTTADTVGETAEATVATNMTTKTDLLTRAREAVEAGDRSLHDAAEALGLAEEEHSATQREMADAVGRSAAWVNALLKWRLSGYEDPSPFDRARSRSAAKRSCKVITPTTATAGGTEGSAAKRKAEYAMDEEESESATSRDVPSSTPKKISAAEAKRILIKAIDESWDDLDDAGRKAVAGHIAKKAGKLVS